MCTPTLHFKLSVYTSVQSQKTYFDLKELPSTLAVAGRQDGSVAAEKTVAPEEIVDGHHGGVPDPEQTGEGARASSQVRKPSSILAGVPHTSLERVLLLINQR